MKKLSVLILATIFLFAATSCSKDDETKKEEAFPTTGVVWKLNSLEVTFNGDVQNATASECQLRSTFEFANGTFTKKYYDDKETECMLYDQKGTYTENNDRELTLTYTEGENIQNAATIQVTRAGLEERISVSDQINGTVEVTRYIYKF